MRIGRAIVEALAADGYDVVIHCRRSVAEARDLARRVAQGGRLATVVRGTLDDERSVRRWWSSAIRAAGPIDVLVNCAATFGQDGIGTITGPALEREFWPNLFAPILLTRLFAEQEPARGNVINLLDRRIAGHDPDRIPYALSKHALAEFTRTAALALAPRIRVNAVAPGPALPPPGRPASHLRLKAGRIPLGTPAGPHEVARAVVALLHLPATTGQIIFVDGGQHLLGNGV